VRGSGGAAVISVRESGAAGTKAKSGRSKPRPYDRKFCCGV